MSAFVRFPGDFFSHHPPHSTRHHSLVAVFGRKWPDLSDHRRAFFIFLSHSHSSINIRDFYFFEPPFLPTRRLGRSFFIEPSPIAPCSFVPFAFFLLPWFFVVCESYCRWIARVKRPVSILSKIANIVFSA
jgi:hypothetical protein